MITDHKTHLQELLQVNGDGSIRYQVISERVLPTIRYLM